jgi:hypothetical protein
MCNAINGESCGCPYTCRAPSAIAAARREAGAGRGLVDVVGQHLSRKSGASAQKAARSLGVGGGGGGGGAGSAGGEGRGHARASRGGGDGGDGEEEV